MTRLMWWSRSSQLDASDVAHAMAGNPITNLVELLRIQQTRTIYVGEKCKLIELREQKRPLHVCVRDPCHVFGQKYPELS